MLKSLPPEFGTNTTENSILDSTIEEVASAIADQQAADGHWVYDLEADATIPAEYILLNHYVDEVDPKTEAKLANYLRKIQGAHGGWPLYHGGDLDMSASVKAYYALKLAGDDIDAPHMVRAREAILENGGAARCNVFTRISLALFEQVPWTACPLIRVEVLLAPRRTPLSVMDKVSYWSRTVMVPLLVLQALKPKASNPLKIGVQELFVTLPEEEKNWLQNPTGHWLGEVMLFADKVARHLVPYMPKFAQRRAIEKAMSFIMERLNGEDGLGGIFPAMANTLMVFDALGYSKSDPTYVTARKAIEKLLVVEGEIAYCQPCLSPVWDTALAAHALLEAGHPGDDPVITRAGKWLKECQILDVKGDWSINRKNVRPGGWAFQYRNDHYPDVDDTAAVVTALDRTGNMDLREAVARGAEWVVGMQGSRGGWGAFDADNEYYWLEHIPFADHGALLDPATADVSARCVSMLAQLGYDRDHPVMKRGLKYLRKEQEANGSWFGRWGTNYIYGTWSVLCAMTWLRSIQHEDGGWGEDCSSYWPDREEIKIESTASQTAWAVLALLAAGEVDSEEVRRGVDWLLSAPREGGKWHEELYNAVGFPKVFYLLYHGYSSYFPLWALARYRNLKTSNTQFPAYGM